MLFNGRSCNLAIILKYFKPKYFNYKVMANCKSYIKSSKCDIYKASKNYRSKNYLKAKKYDKYTY